MYPVPNSSGIVGAQDRDLGKEPNALLLHGSFCLWISGLGEFSKVQRAAATKKVRPCVPSYSLCFLLEAADAGCVPFLTLWYLKAVLF